MAWGFDQEPASGQDIIGRNQFQETDGRGSQGQGQIPGQGGGQTHFAGRGQKIVHTDTRQDLDGRYIAEISRARRRVTSPSKR